MMDAKTWRMLQAIEQSCGYERAPSTAAPLREQRPEILPANASALLLEALTGERLDPLPVGASGRMRRAIEGSA